MSTDGWTIEKALQVGLTMEIGAYTLYNDTAEKVKNPGSKKLLKELASDEIKHKEYFENALKDPKSVINEDRAFELTKVMNLKITDPLKEEQLTSDATYQETLIFAAKSEQIAHNFYLSLSKTYSEHPLSKVWAQFAEMEAGHKLKIEREYDDVVLRED